ncbi:MAG: hypothetical protein ACREE7_18470 [Dongiaceae bacterium]
MAQQPLPQIGWLVMSMQLPFEGVTERREVIDLAGDRRVRAGGIEATEDDAVVVRRCGSADESQDRSRTLVAKFRAGQRRIDAQLAVVEREDLLSLHRIALAARRWSGGTYRNGRRQRKGPRLRGRAIG